MVCPNWQFRPINLIALCVSAVGPYDMHINCPVFRDVSPCIILKVLLCGGLKSIVEKFLCVYLVLVKGRDKLVRKNPAPRKPPSVVPVVVCLITARIFLIVIILWMIPVNGKVKPLRL